MILRMKISKYLVRLTCASWLSRLRTSGSEIGWYMGFKLEFTVGMVLGSPSGYPLGYSTNMFLGLSLEN